MNNNTNFYKIEDSQDGKVVSKLTDKKIFQQYINNNGGNAPDIPEEVVNIYDNIFENVSGINSIYLPSSLKRIPKKLFQNNKDALINFGNYYDIIVREITPDKKYETTYKLKNIHNKNLFNNYCDSHDGNNPYIPEGITSISDFVFKDNRSLRILTLPESTICMCKQGCKNCINLQKVNLSSKFMDFGEEIFMNCSKLSGKFVIPTTIRIIRANVFKGCSPKLRFQIFNKFKVTLEEFVLTNKLLNMPNILALEYNNNNKSLRTNNAFYILKDNKSFKVTREMLIEMNAYNNRIEKHLSVFDDIFIKNKGLETLEFLTYCRQYKIGIPTQYIVCNTPLKYIENYCKLQSDFYDNILTNYIKFVDFKTCDANHTISELKTTQFNIIFTLALITGYFSNETTKQKSSDFLANTLINYFCKGSKNNSFNFALFEKLFKDILNLNNKEYNEEFCDNFIFKPENFKYFITEMLKKENPTQFIRLLIENSGNSQISYSSNNNEYIGHGKLHDKWLTYHNNNNSKNYTKEKHGKSSYLNFLSWACTYGDGSYIFLEKSFKAKNCEKIRPFLKFYSEKSCLLKLSEIFELSEMVEDFIFYNNDPDNIVIKNITLDIAKVKSPIKIERTFNIIKKYKNKILTNFDNDLMSFKTNNFLGKIIRKSDTIVAYANCDIGNCVNIMANGIEYLYESYLDKNCQPFMIYKTDNNNEYPIAHFRINFNEHTRIGTISCLEVAYQVKFEYTLEEKILVAKTFYNIINNFVQIYNSNNNNTIKKITMGQIANYDINDVLTGFFPIITDFINCNADRKVVAPSEYNHFLIWDTTTKPKF